MRKAGLIISAILIVAVVFGGGYFVGKVANTPLATPKIIFGNASDNTSQVVDNTQQGTKKQIEPLTEQEKSWGYVEKGTANLLIGEKLYSANYHIQKLGGAGEPYHWYTVEKIRGCQWDKILIQAYDFFGGHASVINLYGENLYFCAYYTAPNRGDMSIQVENIKAEARISQETATQLLGLADSIIQQLKP